jgi:CHAT domain-containing protein
VHWDRLQGTKQEAATIEQLFTPEVKVYTGANASKATLLEVESPQRLHIATHGFFLADPSPPPLRLFQFEPGSTALTRRQNPLLSSGLVLAGANRTTSDPTDDNGILTAMEASALRLQGTKLAVLSACETGIGETRRGQGVFGLRRAFELAGAKTVVLSLWKISDRGTAELMGDFYSRLKRGESNGQALRNAQLRFINDAPFQHPYFWAPFVSVGEP